MNLVFDIGNTNTKMALFEGAELQCMQTVKTVDAATLKDFCKRATPKNIYASVVGLMPHWNEIIPAGIPIHIVDASVALPFENAYGTPHTLGSDRIAAMVGALLHYSEPLLVIDAGSCITLDYLDENRHYRGGAILPGMQMKLNALHTFTNRLPLLTLSDVEKLPIVGNNTEQSIVAGTLTATVLALEAFIERYRQMSTLPLHVVMTGGDSRLLQRLVDVNIAIDPYLVLHGTNAIFRNK